MEQDLVKKEASRIDKWIKYAATRTWIRTGLFVVALLETTISPLLPELVVAAILSYRKDISWKLLSIISALGSTTGAGILYLLGKYLYKAHQAFFERIMDASVLATYTQNLFTHNAFVSIFLAAFTPLPDRIFAFLSGVFSLPLFIVLSAFFTGRIIRVGIVAYFSYRFGDEARAYILKNTKRVTIILVLVIALYILLKVRGIL